MKQIARIVIGESDATAEEAVRWVRELCTELQIPRLRTYNVGRGDLSALREKAAVASSMKGNPIELSKAEMEEILERAL